MVVLHSQIWECIYMELNERKTTMEFELQENLTSAQRYYRKRRGHNISKNSYTCMNRKCLSYIGEKVFDKYKDACPFCGCKEYSEMRKG